MAKPGALIKRSRGAVVPPPLTVTQLLLDVSLVRLLLAVLGVAFRPVQVSERLLTLHPCCACALLSLLFSVLLEPELHELLAAHFLGAGHAFRPVTLPGGQAPAPTCRAVHRAARHAALCPRRCRPAGAHGAGAWQWRCGASCCAPSASWPRRRAPGRCASWGAACWKCGAGTWRRVGGAGCCAWGVGRGRGADPGPCCWRPHGSRMDRWACVEGGHLWQRHLTLRCLALGACVPSLAGLQRGWWWHQRCRLPPSMCET